MKGEKQSIPDNDKKWKIDFKKDEPKKKQVTLKKSDLRKSQEDTPRDFHNELEFYTLETKTRIAMADLLKPLFVDVDSDRANVAEMGESFNLME